MLTVVLHLAVSIVYSEKRELNGHGKNPTVASTLGPSVSKVSLTARSWVQVAETSLEGLQYSEQEVQYTLEAFPRYL